MRKQSKFLFVFICSFSSFVFAVVHGDSGLMHRMKVTVEGNVKMSYVFKEGHPGYKQITENCEMNELTFKEGNEGEITHLFIPIDLSTEQKDNSAIDSV